MYAYPYAEFLIFVLRRKWCHSSGGLPDAGEGDATEQLDTEALPYELWKLIIVNPSILGKPWDTNCMNVVSDHVFDIVYRVPETGHVQCVIIYASGLGSHGGSGWMGMATGFGDDDEPAVFS